MTRKVCYTIKKVGQGDCNVLAWWRLEDGQWLVICLDDGLTRMAFAFARDWHPSLDVFDYAEYE